MELKTIALFFAGVGVGAFVTRQLLKEKYEQILDEEIERVNKVLYEERMRLYEEADRVNEERDRKKENEKEVKTFRHEIAKQNYDAYFKETEEAPVEKPQEPYIITANEFATDRAHDKITLTHYINAGIIAEEDDILGPEADDIVGTEWMDKFDEGEEKGVVYVRNEKLGADYEILRDDSDAEYVREILGLNE